MNLAVKVRDYRYAKGWGPDELANRAEISRTALYQIESGKTGLPRAGTLRRIAMALDVSMEDLLGNGELPDSSTEVMSRSTRRSRSHWVAVEGGPLSLPVEAVDTTPIFSQSNGDESRFQMEKGSRVPSTAFSSVFHREGELMAKLHDLLHSQLGDGVARIVDELHATLPQGRIAR